MICGQFDHFVLVTKHRYLINEAAVLFLPPLTCLEMVVVVVIRKPFTFKKKVKQIIFKQTLCLKCEEYFMYSFLDDVIYFLLFIY